MNRPAQTAYTREAHAGIPELAPDLIARGHGDRRRHEDLARAGLRTPTSYSQAVPIAVPRLRLLEARLDIVHGRHRTARRGLDRALRDAQRFGMPWEQAEARRRTASLG